MPLTTGTGRALLVKKTVSATNASVVSSSTATNALTGGVTVTVPVPSSVSAGNLLLAIAASGTETWTPPSGWTLFGTKALSGNSPQISIFTKTATASEVTPYIFTSNNGLSDATNIIILNISGSPTPSINGMFSNYHTSATTAAVTIPTVSAIPTVLNCLPIAIDSIQQLNPSNTGNPTSLKSGWTGAALVVNIDGGNPGNIGNNNGYSACYAASGPTTTDTTTAITSSWTWGGGSSNFTGTSVMLFVTQ